MSEYLSNSVGKKHIHEKLSSSTQTSIAAEQLRAIVCRIESLEIEKAGLAADIRDIFAEAKGNGYEVKTLKQVIKLRAMDAAERDEAEHLLDTYCRAIGLRPQLDLFDDDSTGK